MRMSVPSKSRINDYHGRPVFHDKHNFYWYCREIDVRFKTLYEHGEEPKRYPVAVETTFPHYYEDEDPPINHRFIYEERRVCEHCGGVSYGWPEVDEWEPEYRGNN